MRSNIQILENINDLIAAWCSSLARSDSASLVLDLIHEGQHLLFTLGYMYSEEGSQNQFKTIMEQHLLMWLIGHTARQIDLVEAASTPILDLEAYLSQLVKLENEKSKLERLCMRSLKVESLEKVFCETEKHVQDLKDKTMKLIEDDYMADFTNCIHQLSQSLRQLDADQQMHQDELVRLKNSLETQKQRAMAIGVMQMLAGALSMAGPKGQFVGAALHGAVVGMELSSGDTGHSPVTYKPLVLNWDHELGKQLARTDRALRTLNGSNFESLVGEHEAALVEIESLEEEADQLVENHRHLEHSRPNAEPITRPFMSTRLPPLTDGEVDREQARIRNERDQVLARLHPLKIRERMLRKMIRKEQEAEISKRSGLKEEQKRLERRRTNNRYMKAAATLNAATSLVQDGFRIAQAMNAYDANIKDVENKIGLQRQANNETKDAIQQVENSYDTFTSLFISLKDKLANCDEFNSIDWVVKKKEITDCLNNIKDVVKKWVAPFPQQREAVDRVFDHLTGGYGGIIEFYQLLGSERKDMTLQTTILSLDLLDLGEYRSAIYGLEASFARAKFAVEKRKVVAALEFMDHPVLQTGDYNAARDATDGENPFAGLMDFFGKVRSAIATNAGTLNPNDASLRIAQKQVVLTHTFDPASIKCIMQTGRSPQFHVGITDLTVRAPRGKYVKVLRARQLQFKLAPVNKSVPALFSVYWHAMENVGGMLVKYDPPVECTQTTFEGDKYVNEIARKVQEGQHYLFSPMGTFSIGFDVLPCALPRNLTVVGIADVEYVFA